MATHKQKLKRIRRVEKAITKLQRMHLIYRWGGARLGGHIQSPVRSGEAWTDCSGFALYLAEIADLHIMDRDGSTFSMAREGVAGESPYFTWYIKNDPVDDAHVIVRLRKRPRWWHRGRPKYRWAECGGRDNPQSGGGPTWFRPTQSRIREFPIHRKFKSL